MPKAQATKAKAKNGRGNSAVKAATLGGDDLPVGDDDEDEPTGAIENTDDGGEESDEADESDENSNENSEEEEENGGEDATPKVSASVAKTEVMTPKGPVRVKLVKITMLDTIQSPRIGKFYLADVTGSKKLIKGSSYMVPAPAATVLIGNKKAV